MVNFNSIIFHYSFESCLKTLHKCETALTSQFWSSSVWSWWTGGQGGQNGWGGQGVQGVQGGQGVRVSGCQGVRVVFLISLIIHIDDAFEGWLLAFGYILRFVFVDVFVDVLNFLIMIVFGLIVQVGDCFAGWLLTTGYKTKQILYLSKCLFDIIGFHVYDYFEGWLLVAGYPAVNFIIEHKAALRESFCFAER